MSQYGRFISYTAIAEDLVGNDGVVVSPIGGHIHTVGAAPLYVFGNAVTATLTWAIVGLTDHALLVGDATGNMVSMAAVGLTGQGLMGATGANPSWTGSPSFSGSVTAATDMYTTNGSIYIGDTADATAADLAFLKSRAAGVITSGDALGQIRFDGNDGSGYTSGARITSTNSGTVADSRIAGNLKFFTHPDSLAADPTLRMTIQPTGEVVIASPDSGTGLTISGGGLTVTAGTITMPVAQFGVGVVLSTAAGVLSSSTPGVAGTVLTSTGVGTAPTWQNPDELIWSRETGTPVTMIDRGGYIQANAGAGLTTFVLPATAAMGTQIQIIGESSGGWTITHAVGTNQYIQFGNQATTVTTGSLSSSNRYDSVTLVCRVANTVWSVTTAIGVLNVA